ncbi:MAG: O-antigen ligase [Candidatus Azotimanducaceae bacterium]
MIRYSLLSLFVACVAVYAYRDWFKSLCILIVMMAIIERPDMPKTMLGVPGLNPFNLILVNVIFAYFLSELKDKSKAASKLALPAIYKFFSLFYGLVVFIAVFRMLGDMAGVEDFNSRIGGNAPGTAYLVQTYLINGVKWMIPAFLLYAGVKDEERWRWATACLLFCMFLLALQIIRQMPLGNLTDGTTLQQRAVRVLGRNVGYHRVDLSTLMSGAVWCFFIIRQYIDVTHKKFILGLLAASGVCALALLLTGGRAGIGACAILGVIFSLVRYRILLIIGPLAAIALVALVPAVQERIFEGFDESSHENANLKSGANTIDSEGRDLYAITSGRVLVWPEAVESIKKAPWIGYGTKGMLSSYTSQLVMEKHGAGVLFRHPHNAYLELLLDTGLLGAIPIFLLFVLLLKDSFFLFAANKTKIQMVSGGICFSLVLTQLIASVGAQTFYPREGVVLMWCAVALMLRAKYTWTDSPDSSTPLTVAKKPNHPFQVTPLYSKISR